MDIKELINRIHYNDDESAFNELYKLLINDLNQFAYTFLGDKEICEEITNDVFINIWTGRRVINKIVNPRVYFYVTIKNACLNYLRTISSKKTRTNKLAETYYINFSIDPAHLLIEKELHSKILNAVNDLPPRCRLIFKMVKDDGLTAREVAAILDLSNKTIFAQIAIALKKIQEVIR